MSSHRVPGLLACAAAVAAVALAGSASGAVTGVSVRDNAFKPKSKTVDRGDVVRFTWRGANPHNVKFTKAPAGARKPRACKLRTQGACRRAMQARGTYRYVCTIHLASDNMRGSIRVE